MGWHTCKYCQKPIKPVTSSGDVTMVFDSGRAWVTPDMAPHYVEGHHWQPPTEFIHDIMHQTLVAGHRRQTRSANRPTPVPIGYLAGEFPKGVVPSGFIDRLRQVMKAAATMNTRQRPAF